MNQHKRREGVPPSIHNRPYLISPYPYLELQQNHIEGRVKRCFMHFSKNFWVQGNQEFICLIRETYLIDFFLLLKQLSAGFLQIGAVKNCTKFTAKRLCWRSATLVKERLRHRYFPVNLAKFLKTHFTKNNYDDCLCIYFFKK